MTALPLRRLQSRQLDLSGSNRWSWSQQHEILFAWNHKRHLCLSLERFFRFKETAFMIKNLLENIDFDFDQVDKKPKKTILSLFNIIEEPAKDNARLHLDNQRLRDEINRLKGDQGKPNIKPKRKNISSEKEQKKHKKSSSIRLNGSATMNYCADIFILMQHDFASLLWRQSNYRITLKATASSLNYIFRIPNDKNTCLKPMASKIYLCHPTQSGECPR